MRPSLWILLLASASAGRLAAQLEVIPKFDAAAVERGKATFIGSCGFCHGSNARGGEQGPDLVRSAIVLDDEDGKDLQGFLKQGRPDKGMPSFDLPPAQITDIATFLHSQVAAAAFRNTYKILDILVGDAKAGEAYFNGAGKCNTCHSPTGDLKGIGSKYDPVTLQGKFLMPRGGRGRFGPAEPESDRAAVRVTVTLPSGQSFSGKLDRIDDFNVALTT